MGGYDLSASVVTYNNEKTIRRCVSGLLENAPENGLTLFVCDNGSTDGTLEILKEFADSITLIENGENIGFGAAHNIALDRTKAEYHAFINPDITVNGDVLGKLAEYLCANGDVSLVTPDLLNPDGSRQFVPRLNPSFKYMLSGRLPFLKKLRRRYTMADEKFDLPCEIEVCTGCFMMGRTNQLKEVGGFDKRYFMYMEDADLSRSMRKLGKIMLLPYEKVTHLWNRESSHSLKYLFIHLSSAVKYRKKWRKCK